MPIWRMRVACCIPKATNAYSGGVILIAVPLQQWLHESVLMVRYTYVVCPVIYSLLLLLLLYSSFWLQKVPRVHYGNSS